MGRNTPIEIDPRFDHIYLGEPVQVIEDLGNGWITTEWQDGRRWRQWKDQVKKA